MEAFSFPLGPVCLHFSTGCLHFSTLLQTVCICPHLLSKVVCSVHKINSCLIIHGKQSQLNYLKISSSLTRLKVFVQYHIPLIVECSLHWADLGAVRIYCPHLSTFLWTLCICQHCVCMCPHCVQKLNKKIVRKVIACYYINSYYWSPPNIPRSLFIQISIFLF